MHDRQLRAPADAAKAPLPSTRQRSPPMCAKTSLPRPWSLFGESSGNRRA